MRTTINTSLALLLAGATATSGCDQGSEPDDQGSPTGSPTGNKDGGDKADSSVEAVFMDFEFDGSLQTNFQPFNPSQTIRSQLLYTIGHLNGDNSVGRLDKVVLSNVAVDTQAGVTTISYHAKLLVAWGRLNNIPETYTLRLPKNVSSAALDAFAATYQSTCVDFSQAHDVTSGNMWYYYRPNVGPCSLDPADVVELTATVTASEVQTTGKFPEYDKVWEDDELRVIAVFGKNEDGATSNFDAGISAYNRFVNAIRSELAAHSPTTEPATLPSQPGVANPDVVVGATLPDGKRIHVNALLVDNVRTAGPEFDARYESLTANADLILYNGHAGLGANIRALAQKGEWQQGQYAIAFINGCDTYAYVDSALFDAHSAVNPGDPQGTKHLDIVTNAMPAFFHQLSNTTMAMVRGLLSYEEPRTYEQIFTQVDPTQVVLVTGEHDNTYVPGEPEPEPEPGTWEGLQGEGTVAGDEEIRFETPALPAGRYVFELSGTVDADLYVRMGEAPTVTLYDCRPYSAGTNETCAVDLPAPAPIHVMVRGYAPQSTWSLEGYRE